jgi:hypothetical protein
MKLCGYFWYGSNPFDCGSGDHKKGFGAEGVVLSLRESFYGRTANRVLEETILFSGLESASVRDT